MKHKSVLDQIVKSNDVVHTIPETAAESLIADGFVKRATTSPAPKKGDAAVTLTARGRGYARKSDTVDTPAPAQ